jgi:hypothetical protein
MGLTCGSHMSVTGRGEAARRGSRDSKKKAYFTRVPRARRPAGPAGKQAS